MRPVVQILGPLVMTTLWNRAGHYIFALWFLSFFFLFFPHVISAVAQWMSNVKGFRVLVAFLLHDTLIVGVSQTLWH